MSENKKPTVVCLCGSTRFGQAYKDAMRDETLAGKIVLTVGLLGHEEGIDMAGPVKAMLDELHLRKIDLADEVLVLNVGSQKCPACSKMHFHAKMIACGCGQDMRQMERIGYVGESTRREIAYALSLGKPIRYLNAPEGSQP